MNDYIPVAMPTNEQELRQLRKRYETLKQTLGANVASNEEFRQITMTFNMMRQQQQQRQPQQPSQQQRAFSHPQTADQQHQYGFGPFGQPSGAPSAQQQQPGRIQQQQQQQQQRGQFSNKQHDSSLAWLNFQNDLGVAFDPSSQPPAGPTGTAQGQQQSQQPQGQQSARWKDDDNFMDWLDPMAYGTQEFPQRKQSVTQGRRPSQMQGQIPAQTPNQPQQKPQTPVTAPALAQTPQPPTPVTAQGQHQQKPPQGQQWAGSHAVPMFKSPAMGRAQTPVRVPVTPKLGQKPLASGFLTEEELNALKFQTSALQQAQKQRMLYLQKQRQQMPTQQPPGQQIPSQQQKPQPQAPTPVMVNQKVPATRSNPPRGKRGSVAGPSKVPQPQIVSGQAPQLGTPTMAQAPVYNSSSQMHTPVPPTPKTQAAMNSSMSNMGSMGSISNMASGVPMTPSMALTPGSSRPNAGLGPLSAIPGTGASVHLPDVQSKTEIDMVQKRNQAQQWSSQQYEDDMVAKRFAENFTTGSASGVIDIQLGQDDIRMKKNISEKPESPLGTITGPEEKQIALKPKSKDFKERFGFKATTDPSKIIAKQISFQDFCRSREDLLTLPSLLPIGVSAQGMKRRRNWEISNDISTRRSILESKSNRTIDDEIELKRLRLYKWCRAVRGDLTTTIQYFYSTSIDRSNRVHFARLRRLTLNEAALVEQIYKQQVTQKLESKTLESKNSHEMVNARKAIEYFQQKRNHTKLFHEGVLEYQSNAQREERKKLERSAKQRLQALRANDEEAYIKLLDQIKDTRITHLLKQTNLFLDSLAQAVRTQQNDTLRKKRLDNGESGEPDEETEAPNDEEREKIDYFEVAHRVKEPITEQPSILVGGQLKEYQIKGLQWMVSLYNNNLNGILADEMGLGKTIQSIALISYLYEVKKVKGPFLVLVPLSTLTNWNMEFETWAPSLKRVVYKGPPAARKAHQAVVRSGDFQVLLTTYEYIIKDRPVLSRIEWAHMIIDEGHRMKNSNSKLSSTLTQHYSTRYRLILTGTPLQNNLPELWALLNFVLPKIFNSIKSFDEWFNKPFTNAGSNDKIDLSEEETLLIIRRLHKVLRPFLLRRLKKDVEKYLPNKTEKVIKCKMSSLQSVMYQQLLRHNALFFANESRLSNGVKGLNNRIIQLRKLCNHPFAFEEVENAINPSKITNDLLWRVSGKFELLDKILPKFKMTGHRVLIFFQMTQIMDIMEDFLRYRGIQFLRLDGTTRSEDRSELLRLFNDPDSPYFCFLLSTRAGGLGLNLQTADTVIIYDTDWNPHQDLQAQDRAHRIGQTREVRILRLITENSIEENILERAQGKLKIDGKVIQAGKFDNKSTSEEQEAFLRTLLEAEDTNKDPEEDEIDNDMDDEELNGMLARNEAERELFAEVDRKNALNNIGSKPRLFTEQELPEVCTDAYLQRQIDLEQANAFKEMASRRDRNRKQQINYNDETDLDGPKKKMKLPPTKRRPEDVPNVESPAPAPTGVQPVGRVRRQGRPPKVKETLSPEERERMTRNMVMINERIKKATAPDGRARIDLFLDFPNKRLYPDYYQVIANPIAVIAIEKRIQGKVYQQIDQFAFDWRLMFANARRYNEERSFVYEDANALESIFISSFRELYDREPPQHPLAPQPLRRAPVPQGHQVPPGAQQLPQVVGPNMQTPQVAQAAQAAQAHQVLHGTQSGVMAHNMNHTPSLGHSTLQHQMDMPMGDSPFFASGLQAAPQKPQVSQPARIPQGNRQVPVAQVPQQVPHISQAQQISQASQRVPQQVAQMAHSQTQGIISSQQGPMGTQMGTQMGGQIPSHMANQQPMSSQVPGMGQQQPPDLVAAMASVGSSTLGQPKDDINLDVGMDDAVLGEMLDMGADMDMQGFDVDSYLVGNDSLDNLTNFP